MVEEIAPKTDEPITQEEVISIGEDLAKNAKNPATALKILKILDKKMITGEMLKETLIGKKLAPIITEHNPEIPDTNDEKLMTELKEMRDSLKAKWQTVYNNHKKSKKLHEEVKVDPKPKEKFDIPFIP